MTQTGTGVALAMTTSAHESRERRERLQRARADARREPVLAAAREAFVELGLEGASLHTVGLLVLRHTGRIRMFGRAAQDLFVHYVEDLLRRAPAPAGPRRRP